MKRRKESFYTSYDIYGTVMILCKSCRSFKYRPVPMHLPECEITRADFASALRRIRNEERKSKA